MQTNDFEESTFVERWKFNNFRRSLSHSTNKNSRKREVSTTREMIIHTDDATRKVFVPQHISYGEGYIL